MLECICGEADWGIGVWDATCVSCMRRKMYCKVQKPSFCIPNGFQLPCPASRLGPVSEPGLTPGEIGLVRMVMEQERKAAAEPQQLSRWGSVRASESVAGS